MLSSMGAFCADLAQGNDSQRQAYRLSFAQKQHLEPWQIIDDGVMGGLSQGKTELDAPFFIFSGRISTKNNGGFTSVYRPIADLPTTVDSVKITVKGDGNPYQLRLRSQVMGYDLAYKINFTTKQDALHTLSFKLADFKASFRGRILEGAPVLRAETVSHVGFLITTKQATGFSLAVSAIEFD